MMRTTDMDLVLLPLLAFKHFSLSPLLFPAILNPEHDPNIPAATSLVVSGLRVSAKTVREASGWKYIWAIPYWDKNLCVATSNTLHKNGGFKIPFALVTLLFKSYSNGKLRVLVQCSGTFRIWSLAQMVVKFFLHRTCVWFVFLTIFRPCNYSTCSEFTIVLSLIRTSFLMTHQISLYPKCGIEAHDSTTENQDIGRL